MLSTFGSDLNNEINYIYFENSNMNEITRMSTNMDKIPVFIKDSPFEITFPIAPKSIYCHYPTGNPDDPKSNKMESLKVKVDGTKATITTSDILQQQLAHCDIVFDAEVNSKGTLKFGPNTQEFDLVVGNNPLVLKPSAKTKNTLEISGTSTEALSNSKTLEATFEISTFTFGPDPTCELEVEGTKSPVSFTSFKSGDEVAGISISLPENSIAAGTQFSITCKKDVIQVNHLIKGFEQVVLTAEGSSHFTKFNANSASSVGIAAATVVSVASIISLFF